MKTKVKTGITVPKRALLIGINYKLVPHLELNGCINDAKCIKDVLLSKYGYPADQVRILLDETDTGERFLPTMRNILEGLSWLCADTRSGDQRVLFFSGHGTQIPDANGDESDDNLDEALVTCDERLICDDDILRIFGTLKRGARLTAFFDCCHSGTIADLMYTFKSGYSQCNIDTNNNNYTMSVANKKNKNIAANVSVLSACMDPQTSADSKFDGKWILTDDGNYVYEWATSMGAFTYYLLKTLEELEWSDDIAIHDLMTAVTHKLKETGFTQLPQFSCTQPQAIGDAFCV